MTTFACVSAPHSNKLRSQMSSKASSLTGVGALGGGMVGCSVLANTSPAIRGASSCASRLVKPSNIWAANCENWAERCSVTCAVTRAAISSITLCGMVVVVMASTAVNLTACVIVFAGEVVVTIGGGATTNLTGGNTSASSNTSSSSNMSSASSHRAVVMAGCTEVKLAATAG